jgi:hypothetical protein
MHITVNGVLTKVDVFNAETEKLVCGGDLYRFHNGRWCRLGLCGSRVTYTPVDLRFAVAD